MYTNGSVSIVGNVNFRDGLSAGDVSGLKTIIYACIFLREDVGNIGVGVYSNLSPCVTHTNCLFGSVVIDLQIHTRLDWRYRWPEWLPCFDEFINNIANTMYSKLLPLVAELSRILQECT